MKSGRGRMPRQNRTLPRARSNAQAREKASGVPYRVYSHRGGSSQHRAVHRRWTQPVIFLAVSPPNADAPAAHDRSYQRPSATDYGGGRATTAAVTAAEQHSAFSVRSPAAAARGAAASQPTDTVLFI